MSAWSVYWRSGYRVAGSSDVIVCQFGRTREAAIAEALAARGPVLTQLAEIGIESEVTVWVERWRRRDVTETDAREIVQTDTTKRRVEVVTHRAGATS
jgi:hypothetical protein